MLKFDLGNLDPWKLHVRTYTIPDFAVKPNGDASEQLGRKKQIQFRAQCRASWHDSSTSHLRLASLISTTIKDARRRRIDSLPGQVGEAKGEAHSMSPWFRWRHDVSSPLGWGGLGIPIWEGKRHGPPPRRPMLECNPGKATGARELHEAEVIAD